MYSDVSRYVSNELAEVMPDDAPKSFFGSFGAALLMPDVLSEKLALFNDNFFGLGSEALERETKQEPRPICSEEAVVTVGTVSSKEAETLFTYDGISEGKVIRPNKYELHMRGGKAYDIIELDPSGRLMPKQA